MLGSDFAIRAVTFRIARTAMFSLQVPPMSHSSQIEDPALHFYSLSDFSFVNPATVREAEHLVLDSLVVILPTGQGGLPRLGLVCTALCTLRTAGHWFDQVCEPSRNIR